MTTSNNGVRELSLEEVDMISGGVLTWAEVGSFFKNIADEIVQLIVDTFDDDDKK